MTEKKEDKKQRILNEMWKEMEIDLECYDTDKMKECTAFFKGYSKGLKQAEIINIEEHLNNMIKINKAYQYVTLKEDLK